MTGIFDGMAGILNDVFGGPVSLRTRAGATREVQGIFRDMPVETLDPDGVAVLNLAPQLKLQAPDAVDLARGDEVTVGTRIFAILAQQATGSPDAGAFVIFDLEELDT